MSTHRKMYSRLTDDQLLNLAGEADSLLPESRSALNAELQRRGFGPEDILEQAEQVRIRTSEARQRKPLAQTFNGFGTTTYGKRDFAADGSFLTTKWFVLFWIPLIPLQSLRVKYIGPGTTAIFPGWSRRYLVLSESRPRLLQAISTYGYVASLLIGLWLLGSIHFPTPEIGSSVSLAAVGVWTMIPWLLRRRSR